MSSTHEDSDPKEDNEDELCLASIMSLREPRVDAEQRFARLIAIEVDAMEMDITGWAGDPDRQQFVQHIDRCRNGLEGLSATWQRRADDSLESHEFFERHLHLTLPILSKELEQEFMVRQEEQRMDTQGLTLFSDSTPEQVLWEALDVALQLEWLDRRSRWALQDDYTWLQLVKKHTHSPLPEVLHRFDEFLKERLISMEQIRAGCKQPMAQLKSMYRTLRDSNGTMYQAPEDSNASSGMSSS